MNDRKFAVLVVAAVIVAIIFALKIHGVHS